MDICAKIDNGIVTETIVCSNVNWAVNSLGGFWLLVPAGCFCGIGYTYDGENFIPPEPQEVEDELN
jgi:hypothetical protein